MHARLGRFAAVVWPRTIRRLQSMFSRDWKRTIAGMGAPAAGLALAVACGSVPVIGATIVVPADGDLQAAIDQARPGDILLLQPGATYVGNFVLTAKESDRPITIRTATDDRRLPGPT